jgi:ASC-1-like (ASCH) protein
MEIRKKCWPEYFQKIADGKKKCELRLADFECKKGDVLVLEEWDPKTKEYTGRKIRKKAGYVMKTKEATYWPEEEIEKYGFQIIQLEEE